MVSQLFNSVQVIWLKKTIQLKLQIGLRGGSGHGSVGVLEHGWEVRGAEASGRVPALGRGEARAEVGVVGAYGAGAWSVVD